VDPDTVRGLRRLRGLGLSERPEPVPPIVIEGEDAGWTMGHHSFHPSELPEVLTPAQAALLLQVNEATVLEMAKKGDIPGRKLGAEWRFSRLALMAWLGGPPSGGEG
jgi:excisionase family DNA binding protein